MSATVTTTVPWTLQVTVTIPLTVSDVSVAGQSTKNDGTVNITLPASNAGTVVGPITVTMSDGSAFTGTIAVVADSGSTCPVTVSNNGKLPCNLVVGSSGVAAGSYPLKFQVSS